ncbi:MAG: ATP-binding protein [Rubrivivax sp.]
MDDLASPQLPPRWPALLVWAGAGAALLALDGPLDLANQALLLLAAAAVAAWWCPGWPGALAGVAAVAMFNWRFVPPRHSFAVDLRQHALMLAALLGLVMLLPLLVQALRRQGRLALEAARHEAALRAFGQRLRDVDDPWACAGELQQALARLAGVAPGRVALKGFGTDDQERALGTLDDNRSLGLDLCRRDAQAMGPGTGRHEEQPDLYLPLRGRGGACGALVLQDLGARARDDALRLRAGALCDLFGQALQRARDEAEHRRSRDEAQLQKVRNALLAAVAHDHRTPLATILAAAGSLQEQDARLTPPQRQRLAATIADEAARLRRLTDNTLQLARLDAPGLVLQGDWESADELLAGALQRARRADPQRRTRARVEPGLPLLWCDAVLLSQGLDNLVDNALRYSPQDAPVELLARATPEHLVLAVRDRGHGIAPAWRERVFEPFQRGDPRVSGERPGAGVGLALCRAIARAHGGELRLRARGHGGSSFEFWLPRRAPPPAPEAEA